MLAYGEAVDLNGVKVSLHPAGHIIGSSQIRLEKDGRVVVVSGDYKLAPRSEDPTATPFETVRCDEFVTECTFGLPIFRWENAFDVAGEMLAWWRDCAANDRNAIISAYALGKAQRVMRLIADVAGKDGMPGPILLHGAVTGLCEAYEASGVDLPQWEAVTVESAKVHKGRALVIAPPSALGTPWVRKLRPFETASASGWSAVRGTRRIRSIDRGFVISDHADWDSILNAIVSSGAERVGVTHGQTGPLIRYLREQGIDAYDLPTRFTGEDETGGEDEEEPVAAASIEEDA